MTGPTVSGSSPVRADLHIHTTASDGCWKPERVVAEALARSIGLIAVTDHDTTAAVQPTEARAREAGLAFIRGVEVSSRWDSYLLHILAFGFEPDNEGLASLLRDNTAEWDLHSQAVIQGLINAGHPITLADYETYHPDHSLGGWKVLRFLVDRGVCTGINDYFDRLLPGLALPQTQFAHPTAVLATIRQAGGVPIVAHPGASLRSSNGFETALDQLLHLGIGGLECYSQYHDQAETAFFLEWTRRHGLLVTGGSDSHGGFVGRELGVPFVDTADLDLGELAERVIR